MSWRVLKYPPGRAGGDAVETTRLDTTRGAAALVAYEGSNKFVRCNTHVPATPLRVTERELTTRNAQSSGA